MHIENTESSTELSVPDSEENTVDDEFDMMKKGT